MKKKLNNHIKNQDYVKVYITDEDESSITHFEGIVFEQTDELILMSDSTDFFYDGLVIFRKKDVSEIKHTDNERFLRHIMKEEGLIESTLKNREAVKFSLGTLQNTLTQLKKLGNAIIIECEYGDDSTFQIGPVNEVTDTYVKLDYFNARGEYDLKPTSSKLDEITHIKIDSPYANLFHKYSSKVD
ncbi:MAG: hypothetical protein ABJN36_05130 [Cyclobacteriaceae bacterium]